MKKEQFYALIIIVLLMINVGTLVFVWTSKVDGGHIRHRPPATPGHVIINELQLDIEQQRQFKLFRQTHRKATDSVQRHIRDAQSALFSLVKSDEMDMEVRDSLLDRIEQYESAKHLVTIQHFRDIRTILTPDQKMLFNELMEEIGSRITGPVRPPHRP